MAWQVLLVDDEMPALRFVQNLIEKYAPDFTILQMCSSAEAALVFLQSNTIDVLITDISMQKMNGIELAMAARAMQPDVHIVIISGYAEFEYAQAAIQAAVDDYILKPVSIGQMKRVMAKLKELLEEEQATTAVTLLPALACGQPSSKKNLNRWWGSRNYRFALIRWGGTDPRMTKPLRATSLILPFNSQLFALRGRDEDEQILICAAADIEPFLSDVSVYMTQRYGVSTWTVIYQPEPQPVVMLNSFLSQAFPMLRHLSVIGKHQMIPITQTGAGSAAKEESLLSVSDMNQFQYYCSTGKFSNVKEFLLSVAAALENDAVPQHRVYRLAEQLVLQLAGTFPYIKNNYEQLKTSIADLFIYASSYGELLSSLYTVLFENETNVRDRKLSTKELYDYAVLYIQQHYAEPLSVQSVCDELGISPTYLSRLFRKFGDTTFNTYLMKQRMDVAISLLSDKPDMLLRDVAACVGYEDSSYFAKVFYQYTGKKPSQYVDEQKAD